MQKLDEFKITCPKCKTITIMKASMMVNLIKEDSVHIGGNCIVCNNHCGQEIIDAKRLIDKYNECCDKLMDCKNIKFTFAE